MVDAEEVIERLNRAIGKYEYMVEQERKSEAEHLPYCGTESVLKLLKEIYEGNEYYQKKYIDHEEMER